MKNTEEKPVVNEEEYYQPDDDVEYYDPNHKKKVITAVVIGVVVLIAAIVLLVLSLTGTAFKTTRTLENFVGMSYDELISSQQYDYEFVMQQEKTEESEPGVIISQAPEAGTKVLPDSQVTLVVAISADDITVPNLYDLDVEMAKNALAQEGLNNYTITSVASDTVEENKVVYSNPKAGTVVSADTQITVFVSSGPTTEEIKQINIPDVSGLSQEGARAFLEKSGFKNINFSTKDSELPKGVVISQNPVAGTLITEDDKITITISSGVTTTTTKASSKVSLTVALPECIDENGEFVKDNLVVELDGEVYLSQNVTLNGKNANVSITIEDSPDVQVRVSLKNTGAVEVRSITQAPESKKLSVNFSGFSYDHSTGNTNEEEENSGLAE